MPPSKGGHPSAERVQLRYTKPERFWSAEKIFEGEGVLSLFSAVLSMLPHRIATLVDGLHDFRGSPTRLGKSHSRILANASLADRSSAVMRPGSS
jgi:hypothetical protein